MPIGGAPRWVVMNWQINILGGAATSLNPTFGAKLVKNSDDATVGNSFTGLGQADLSLPGLVSVKGFMPMQAGPGDYFEVWLLASAATTQPVFPSQFGLGTLATDPHPAHSYFAGVMPDDSDLAALTAQVAAAQASITDLQTRLAALEI